MEVRHIAELQVRGKIGWESAVVDGGLQAIYRGKIFLVHQ